MRQKDAEEKDLCQREAQKKRDHQRNMEVGVRYQDRVLEIVGL
jgi:hypothetical protein